MIFWGTHKISPQCVCMLTIDNNIFPTDVMECTFFFFLMKASLLNRLQTVLGVKQRTVPSWVKPLNELPHLIRCSHHALKQTTCPKMFWKYSEGASATRAREGGVPICRYISQPCLGMGSHCIVSYHSFSWL